MIEAREFRPELMSRRGEFTAWLIAIGVGAGIYIFSSSAPGSTNCLWPFVALMIFFAASISLGNWMDRRTVLRLGDDGVAYENGLRSVRLGWTEVQNVAVVTARSGRRVQVQGERSHFTFKTLSVTSMLGQSMRTGFADGQEILDAILKSSEMKLTKEAEGVYYYARA